MILVHCKNAQAGNRVRTLKNELMTSNEIFFLKKTYQIVDESESKSDVNVVEGHTEGRQHVKQGHLGPHHVDDRKYRNLVNRILFFMRKKCCIISSD